MCLCESNLIESYGAIYLAAQFTMICSVVLSLRNSWKLTTTEAKIAELHSSDNHFVRRTSKSGTTPQNASEQHDNNKNNKPEQKGFNNSLILSSTTITIYRGGMMLLTLLAILAVDFPIIFPRRFVKTEVYGYSLMDLGASSFVVASGLVSHRAKRKLHPPSATIWNTFLFKVLPVMVMGLLRLVTHKGLEYQEHVSEYGIHWNFFFTLSWLAALSTVFRIIIPNQPPSWMVPIAILALYQIALSWPSINLQHYIENASRSCLSYDNMVCHTFAANREGILGCIPYAGLYLLSEKIAYDFVWNTENSTNRAATTNNSSNIRRSRCLLYQTILWTVVWQILVAVFKLDVSRRSTNAPFCIWSLVANLWQITAIHYILVAFNSETPNPENNDNTTKPITDASILLPIVLKALNRHGLIVFVVSNLLTGIVNLSMNTIGVTKGWIAFAVLLLYMSVVAMLALSIEQIQSLFIRGSNQGRFLFSTKSKKS